MLKPITMTCRLSIFAYKPSLKVVVKNMTTSYSVASTSVLVQVFIILKPQNILFLTVIQCARKKKKNTQYVTVEALDKETPGSMDDFFVHIRALVAVGKGSAMRYLTEGAREGECRSVYVFTLSACCPLRLNSVNECSLQGCRGDGLQ